MKACDGARGEANSRPLVVRCDLEGRSPVHQDLGRPGVLAHLMDDLRDEQLARDPWIWIDRVRDNTRPHIDMESLAREEGLRGDLVRLAAQWGDDAEGATAMVEELLAPLLGQLPGRRELELSPQELLQKARDLCVDRLSEDDG